MEPRLGYWGHYYRENLYLGSVFHVEELVDDVEKRCPIEPRLLTGTGAFLGPHDFIVFRIFLVVRLDECHHFLQRLFPRRSQNLVE
jgi:hypothetical protein